MKLFKVILFLIISSFLLITCTEDEFTGRPYPRLRTLPVTNITPEGATFNAEITFRGDFEIVEYGFLWSEDGNPLTNNSEKQIIKKDIQNSIFSFNITRSLKVNQNYFLRSFLQTNDFTVYGQVIEFVSDGSIPPVINEVMPREIYYSDTLSIYGENFSQLINNNKVQVNTIEIQQITFHSDSLIKFRIPDELNQKAFIVSVSTGTKSSFKDSIRFTPPKIKRVEPQNFVFGDTLEIRGSYFGYKKELSSITINDEPASIINGDSTRINVIIPVVSEPIKIQVHNSVGQSSTNTSLQIAQPLITEISPKEIIVTPFFRVSRNRITINGNNFGYLKGGTEAYLGAEEVDILEMSNNSMVVEFPFDIILDSHFPTISVNVDSKSSTVSNELEILTPWIRKKNLPGVGKVSFSINGFGYAGLSLESTSFWKFNPISNSWSEITRFPGLPRILASSFVIEDDAFVGGGMVADDNTRQFWKYSSSSNSWSKIADFPYDISEAIGLSNSGNGYIITRQTENNFWKYDKGNDEWVPLIDLQIDHDNDFISSGFTFNDKIYIVVRHVSDNFRELYEFDLQTMNWSAKTGPKITNRGLTKAISLNGYGYVLTNNSTVMDRYDPLNDSWTSLTRVFDLSRDYEIFFHIGDKLYYGGNDEYSSRDCPCVSDLWEYDFSYE